MSRKPFVAAGLVCLLALSIGCGQDAPTPVSPTATTDVADSAANADGSTLKATAPDAQSPKDGVQVEGEVVLRIANAQAKFASVPLSYRFEVFNESSQRVWESGLVGAGDGNTQVNVPALEFNKVHTWRARAEYLGAVGPWSATATFKTPEGGYIRGNEVLDPLTNGKTVGEVHGPVTFVQGEGARIETNLSRITYQLDVTLQEGEYSFVAQGVDEGNNGDKTKVMSMAEGHGDVTDNDYRASLEVRGQDYGDTPGTVAFRMITGDAGDHDRIHDTQRRVVSWSRAQTYFFRIWWRFGQAGYEIRLNGPGGPMHDQASLGLGGRWYRPGHDGVNPHVVHIGAPNTRAGELNASHPQMTVRNVWVSSRPRPNF